MKMTAESEKWTNSVMVNVKIPCLDYLAGMRGQSVMRRFRSNLPEHITLAKVSQGGASLYLRFRVKLTDRQEFQRRLSNSLGEVAGQLDHLVRVWLGMSPEHQVQVREAPTAW